MFVRYFRCYFNYTRMILTLRSNGFLSFGIAFRNVVPLQISASNWLLSMHNGDWPAFGWPLDDDVNDAGQGGGGGGSGGGGGGAEFIFI